MGGHRNLLTLSLTAEGELGDGVGGKENAGDRGHRDDVEQGRGGGQGRYVCSCL